MYICYFDGSSQESGKVVVAGFIGKLNKYESVEEICYCFKRTWDVPYGFSLHEDIAAINAVKEVKNYFGNEFENEKITFVNDSMGLYKEMKNLKSKKVNMLEIFNKNYALAKNRPNLVNDLGVWAEEINQEYSELKDLSFEKIKFLHARRSNVGIAIVNVWTKEPDVWMTSQQSVYVASSLKKITTRHFLYDLTEKAVIKKN